MLGKSISLDYLKRECERAIAEPTYENTFKRLHLNIVTESDVRWLPMDKWDICSGDIPEHVLRGPCFGGLDMSTNDDLTSFALVWPQEDTRIKYYAKAWHWIPGDNAKKREQKDRVPYETWARQGYIRMTAGNVVDHDAVRKDIQDLDEEYDIEEIAIDPHNSTQIQSQLMGDGFTIVRHSQKGYAMNAPSKELERAVVGGEFVYEENPVLRWEASNVTVIMDDENNIRPSKGRSVEKIDGVVAVIMGISRAMVRETTGCVYDKRGFITL
jgi:phage terminase large subunit-like protein